MAETANFEATSGVAVLAAVLGVASALGLALGAGGAAAGLLTPFVGFRLFLLGVLIGIAALGVGVAGLLATRPAKSRAGRRRALVGTLCAVPAVLVLAIAGIGGGRYPRINDVTTSPEEPPEYTAAADYGRRSQTEMAYDPAFAALQREGYPHLTPIELDAAPAEALARAEGAARALGWTLVASDPAAGTLEAYDVTGIFGFVDDVSVRVRPTTGGGSVVDVRSKSRDGQGDIGANAERIDAFRDELLR